MGDPKGLTYIYIYRERERGGIMAQTKEINLNVLPEEIKKELLDFYQYLVTKYGKQRLERKSPTKDKN